MALLLLSALLFDIGCEAHLNTCIDLAVYILLQVLIGPGAYRAQTKYAVFGAQFYSHIVAGVRVWSRGLVPADENIAFIPGPLEIVCLKLLDLAFDNLELGLGSHNIIESLLELSLTHYK
jgi:hypothetical protein